MSRARVLAVLLLLAWLATVVLQLATGPGGPGDPARALRGVLATAGLAEPLDGTEQAIVELRLWRALAAGLVGACLALAGALLQGLFRNGLADGTVLGVNAGASLGASAAILVIGGYAPVAFGTALDPSLQRLLIPAFAFVAALLTALLVIGVASIGGRISVPTLLLCGIAVNACIAGVLATLQSFVIEDWEVARALLAWTFGSFDDRKAHHVVLALGGLLLALAIVPLVATELDLFAAGEDDARVLGVHVGRTKTLALGAAALATACAVAAAGQIGFLGLIVPHAVRLVAGPSHRRVLWLSALGGAVFLTGTDLLQRAFLGDYRLQPGVVMSLLGGPFFLWLLLRNRRSVAGW